jgi:hypothetical protein
MKRKIALGCAAAIFCTGLAGAQPFKTHVKSRLLDFEYSWPSEVGAVPALVRHFTKDMREERKAMLAQQSADAGDMEGNRQVLPYSFYRDVTSVGQSTRLLSLKIETYYFTGGAHGNADSEPFLWDRHRGKRIPFESLLMDQAEETRLLRSPFCHALSEEQTKRNGWTVAPFENCPKFSELTILPADRSHNGRFDTIHLIADQDRAGSHAEGAYDISVPVSMNIMPALKPQYRASFEAQRQ